MDKVWFDSWALSLVVFIPLVGALILMALPSKNELVLKATALGVSLVSLLVGVGIVIRYLTANDEQGQNWIDSTGTLRMVVNRPWIEVINSRFHVGLDGLAMPMLLLSLVIVPLCIIYSWNHFPEPHNPKAFLTLILVLAAGMNGVFVAQDLILFFVFFEVVLLPMYFMIGIWGGERRKYASIKFFLYTLFGSALMIVSFLAIYFKSPVVTPELAEQFGLGMQTVGQHSFDIPFLAEWAGAGLSSGLTALIFGGLFMGFAIKVPMFPFHTWLPDAHTEAPTVGSVLLAAVLLKLGTYGFIRVAIPILPEGAVDWAPYIGLLAVIGIIYGALGSLAQRDVKRLIAFSSVAHMGFTMLGIATLTDYGINAAIFGMVAHGLITGMLFFVAGSLHERFHTREIDRLGGLLSQAPKLGWILGFCAMASLGLPGLAGFWGEFPAILSAYNPADGLSEGLFRGYMVVAAIGTVFAAAYLLFMYQRVAFGTPADEFKDAHIHDVHRPEWIAWSPLLAAIVILGIFPNLIFKQTDDAVQRMLTTAGITTSASSSHHEDDQHGGAGHSDNDTSGMSDDEIREQLQDDANAPVGESVSE